MVRAAGDQYNGLAFLNLLFDTSINDLGNMINDMNLRKEFDNGMTLTAGYYYSKQDIATQLEQLEYLYPNLRWQQFSIFAY